MCKEYLEPSAAVSIHHRLGLPKPCLNFDLANACLGFVNGMQDLAPAMMIDAGQIEYALIVDGEGSRTPQERTLARLSQEGTTAGDVYDNFATLTLGSGGAAMVIGRADRHPDGHRIIGGVARAATQHHTLCVGDLDSMRTDTRALLEAGLAHSEATWKESQTEFDWSDMDCYVIHQISLVHTSTMCERLGIDQAKAPLTFPTRGNIGPASVPFTLAQQSDSLESRRPACCAWASARASNAMCLEMAW